jgi:hypothetical protein
MPEIENVAGRSIAELVLGEYQYPDIGCMQ